uniref:ATP-dependent RNA helicase n=1 Tax=Neobodo designis TaxID=312471 RepID=A0A7S1QSA5_NEODS|mmetsp:Transcript_51133/g.157694  ORF Transcript_51133/g.157694 Transcript_51133/m.157694 type:complete len:523 (+) Transcript_51133:32-1600(+)
MSQETPAAPEGATFEQLGGAGWLVRQAASLHITSPTEVQRATIPAVLRGKHVVAGAATGSGKTAAYALPVLQRVAEEAYGVFCLVMTPSRELAYQILDQFIAFGAPIALRTAIVIGGTAHGKQLEAVQARPHVVVGTPGRLRMLFETFPEATAAARNVAFLVLDEADRLVEGDMRDDTLAAVAALGAPKPFRRTLMLSATVNTELTDPAEGLLPQLGVTDAGTLAVCCTSSETLQAERAIRTVAPNLAQEYIFVPLHVKLQFLVCLLRTRDKAQSAIIFVNSCVRCEVVRLTLQLLGFPVASLNSLLTQQQRLNSLAMFKAGFAKFLIATDVAARGLDIPEVALVVHYDVPKLSATYVHRVGRTARAGRSGTSIALVTSSDVDLVHKLEKRVKSRLKEHRHPKINDDAVLEILDHVSGAKVEARLTVKRDFGDRAAYHKEAAAEKKSAINRAIRDDQKSVKRAAAQSAAQGSGGKKSKAKTAAAEKAASPKSPDAPDKPRKSASPGKKKATTPKRKPSTPTK